jgi:hypothetical protein
MFPTQKTVIHDIIDGIGDFMAAYGWYILFLIIAIYFFQENIKKFREDMSLKRAQNPHRVKILEEERKRVRLKQQMEANKALLEAKEREASEPSAAETIPKKPKAAPPPSAPPSGGYNPMSGGGSNIQTFKPSGGGMRNRRRG